MQKTASEQPSTARMEPRIPGNQGICTNVVTSSHSEREFSVPVWSILPSPWLFHMMECSYDFWFRTNSTWSLKGKNNKYGKHLIQNNMFIQRPVDFGGWKGPLLMWSTASVCVFVHVCLCAGAGCRVFALDV